jgi:transcriptional regulator with XRE-family HTH domain
VGQAIRRLPETPALRASGTGPEPLGSWLARERRLRGLTLDDLAAATRIPRRSLERLEAGAFDAQPDGFTRGFVRTVADAIGLDPVEASARLLGEAAPERRGHAARARAAALALAGLVALALLAAALPAWWRSVAGARGGAAAAEPQPTRRDFVRELARERAQEVAPPAPPPPARRAP